MENKSYLFGVVCCVIATLAWGGMFPIMTDALRHIDAFNFTFFRYGLAGIAFAVLLLYKEGVFSFYLKGEKIGLAWLFGTAGFAGFGFLVFWGQQLAGESGALTASIMMATMPMLSLLVVWVLKKVPPAKSTIAFILLSFSGVMLVITKGQMITFFESSSHFWANGLIILGALCWVLYTLGASYFPHWSPIKYTAITTLLGMTSVAFIDLSLILSGFITMPTWESLRHVLPHLCYMAFVAGLIAVLCWNIGNQIITPTNGVLFMDLVPITAFIISAINGMMPLSIQLFGAAITALALVLNNLNQRRIAKAKSIGIHQGIPAFNK